MSKITYPRMEMMMIDLEEYLNHKNRLLHKTLENDFKNNQLDSINQQTSFIRGFYTIVIKI